MILALFACSNEEEITTGTIKGFVLTTTGDTVITGARLTTSPSSDTAFSGSDGSFSLFDVEPGNYYLTAHKSGYSDGTVPVIVLANATASVVFKLSRTPVDLSGQWDGDIAYDVSAFPLLLDFLKVTTDSVQGTMVIEFGDGTETFPINSKLFFNNDSLHFNLAHTFGDCYAFDMWGRVINADSLSGKWRYQCNNQQEVIMPWHAKRIVK